jgi:adenylate cyclase
MEPQALREYLNRFLTRMTEVVHRHEGTVDKYMGDAIMAFWGAPIDDAKQEDNAVAAALDMQKAIQQLNEEFEVRGWPLLAIGVGINSGTARVGDMGSQLRRTYTAIGDAVNLAARLEALTKRFNLPVLVGESTAKYVTNVPLEPLGETDVPGRTERVRVYCPKVFIQVSPRVPETVV